MVRRISTNKGHQLLWNSLCFSKTIKILMPSIDTNFLNLGIHSFGHFATFKDFKVANLFKH